MAGVTVLVLAAESFLVGMRIIYAVDRISGKEYKLNEVWRQRWFYGSVFLCMIFLGTIGIFLNAGLSRIRLLDLIGTYLMLAAVDWKCREVPDPVVICYFAGQVLLGVGDKGWPIVYGTMVCGLVFGLIVLLFAGCSKGRFGMGDAKLLGITALTTGWRYVFQVMCLAFFLAFLYSIWLLAVRKSDKKTEFPFVPFLFAGVVIQLF